MDAAELAKIDKECGFSHTIVKEKVSIWMFPAFLRTKDSEAVLCEPLTEFGPATNNKIAISHFWRLIIRFFFICTVKHEWRLRPRYTNFCVSQRIQSQNLNANEFEFIVRHLCSTIKKLFNSFWKYIAQLTSKKEVVKCNMNNFRIFATYIGTIYIYNIKLYVYVGV